MQNVGYALAISDVFRHDVLMKFHAQNQHDKALELMRRGGIFRLRDLVSEGVTTSTVSRMQMAGEIVRIGRGLYQLPDAVTDVNHDLAVASKAVPSGVICLASALAFHELTDTIPSRVWIAIGSKDRKPKISHPPLEVVRFSRERIRARVEVHAIEHVSVPITSPAKTIVDLFRYRRTEGKRFKSSPGLNLALEGLREVLRQRKATPAELASCAQEEGMWTVVRPYLEAMTANA